MRSFWTAHRSRTWTRRKPFRITCGVSGFLGLFFRQSAGKIAPKIRKRHWCGRSDGVHSCRICAYKKKRKNANIAKIECGGGLTVSHRVSHHVSPPPHSIFAILAFLHLFNYPGKSRKSAPDGQQRLKITYRRSSQGPPAGSKNIQPQNHTCFTIRFTSTKTMEHSCCWQATSLATMPG